MLANPPLIENTEMSKRIVTIKKLPVIHEDKKKSNARHAKANILAFIPNKRQPFFIG